MTTDPPPRRLEDSIIARSAGAASRRLSAAARCLASVWPARRRQSLVLLGATAVILSGSASCLSIFEGRPAASSAGAFTIRGVSFPSYHNGTYASSDSAAALADLARTGANFVAIIPTWFSKTTRDSEFFASDHTESDASVVKAISEAHALGLSVLLKPHVDPADGKPRAEYAPADPAAWLANYKSLLLHYAAMATANHVEMFNIGCELDSMVGPRYRSQWLSIIRAVRLVYHGPIIYAHGWPGLNPVSFLDAVDYIGVDAYDPLSDARNPTVAELAAGWTTISSNPWVARRLAFHSPMANYRALWERYHKPIIFTEIGYKSVAGAVGRPGDWKWDGPVDLQAQARAYEAFFEVWSRQTAWVKGAFFWNWEPATRPEQTVWGLKGYTPQDKPAALVLTRWYQYMAGSDPSLTAAVARHAP